MISRELLSEVLNIKTDYLGYIDRSKNIEFRESQGFLKKINIYELAYKCKEWAYKQEIGKTGTYYNGCGWSQQHLMYGITIVTKYCDNEYLVTIDNGKDLNCSLDFYGLSAMHNCSIEQFNYKANTVKDICFYADTEPEAIFNACEWIMEGICGKNNR